MSSKFIKSNGNLITTISGIRLPKSACRYSEGKYYKMGDSSVKDSGDVYQVRNLKTNVRKWYKTNTGYIVYDYRLEMYMLKSDLEVIVENGIVGFDENNKPIFGTFSQDLLSPSTTQVSYQGKIYICLAEELVINCRKFKEAISDGIFYERNALPALLFTEPVSCSAEYKQSLPYDSKGITKKWAKRHKDTYKPNFFPQVEKYHHVLDDLTFGLEFETIKGKIPDSLCNRLGLIPLRDGSIEGLEYVTIPLKGKDGLQTVIDSVEQLRKRTRFNKDCSLHVHIGNIPRSEEFFIGLYKVLFRIQEEMYDMFPFHKLKNLGVKKKPYTKPLPLSTMLKLDTKISSKTTKENFEIIYRFLSMGQSYANFGNHIDNITNHPSDPNGTSKWNIRTRYHWVNLIPLLFGNKQTVEFRIHTPTYDTNKVINYLFICALIINFTKKNLNTILKNPSVVAELTLHDILLSMIDKEGQVLASELSGYIDSRKEFNTRRLRNGDIIADEDEFRYSPRYINWKKPLTSIELARIEELTKKGKLVRKKKAAVFHGHVLHHFEQAMQAPPIDVPHNFGNNPIGNG